VIAEVTCEEGRRHIALRQERFWDEVIRVLTRLDRLERDRPARPGFQAYARGKLRPVFDRLGWDKTEGEPLQREFLRTRLIRVLGDLGDAGILTEAKQRFTEFVREPASLRPGLRDPVTHLVGRTADRATYDLLHDLAHKAGASHKERMTAAERRVARKADCARPPANPRSPPLATVNNRSAFIHLSASKGQVEPRRCHHRHPSTHPSGLFLSRAAHIDASRSQFAQKKCMIACSSQLAT
jgi:hypothetical protein